jgi:hypothetical protein
VPKCKKNPDGTGQTKGVQRHLRVEKMRPI